MKQIKDAMMKWLDDEIDGLKNTEAEFKIIRLHTLEEVRTKLTEVIVEEFHKLSEKKENEDA